MRSMLDGNSAALRLNMGAHDANAAIAESITPRDLEIATDELVGELCAGQKIGRLHAGAIFDEAMQVGGNCGHHGLVQLLEGILGLDRSRSDDALILRANTLVDDAKGFIQRYVDAHPDLVRERAEQNERARREDAE